MRFGKELLEPWGMLLAATSAGAAWAVQLPVLAAAGVGVGVLAARAGIATLTREKDPEPRVPKKLDVDPASPEAAWLRRAEGAANGFVSISDSLSNGPLAERVGDMEPIVRETVETLHRLAGRATSTGKALARIDLEAITAEKRNVARSLRHAGDDVRPDLEQALSSVQAQEDVHGRLSSARNKLLAQLQSGALGLDSLVARVAELSASLEDTVVETGAIGDLTDQLEGIRRGVVETDESTRRSLS